ncbi:MAG: cell division protein ZapE [Proteobacteria bacterium]|nr:cell division protein ZapE [Pseudomonadota bacterium]
MDHHSAPDPEHAYRALLEDGTLKSDPSQAQAMGRLQDLHQRLAAYTPQMGTTGWKARLNLGGKKIPPPKGIYMWGGVGRGKSMLMDLFFETTATAERKRVHFHAFMLEVHKRMHNYREAVQAGKAVETTDPLAALARVITDQAWLLCFDEFHVTDIADAMILGRLFEALFDQGVVIVATSNRPPEDLYKDGLQRALFLPFIDMLGEKLEVMELNADVDFRLDRLKAMDVYITPADAEAEARLDEDFRSLSIGAIAAPVTLLVQGRDVVIPKVAEGVAMAGFDDLCEKPLGAGDYLEIAACFHTLVLKGIPKLGSEKRNEAKRFVTLIDALYEAKVNLICSADAPAEALYTEGDGAFEFERTVSRLMEMQSADYMALPHAG